jgi:hypothetical protein
VGPILDVKVNDRKTRRQEVKFVDQSDKTMFVTLTLWEFVCQVFTTEWKPFVTGNVVKPILLRLNNVFVVH